MVKPSTLYLTLNDPKDLVRLCWIALSEMLPDRDWTEFDDIPAGALKILTHDVNHMVECGGDADEFAHAHDLPDVSAFHKDAGEYYMMIALMVRIVIKARSIDPGARINRTTKKESKNAESKEGEQNPSEVHGSDDAETHGSIISEGVEGGDTRTEGTASSPSDQEGV